MTDANVTTFLFTDIEGSTAWWEREPERMQGALARHDALARDVVAAHRGEFVKGTGDGIHAVFADPLDGITAAVALQVALADPAALNGIPLRVRSGLHAGVDARRDNDFYGNAVNRAARVMNAAHGGQILVSQTVEGLVRGRLPAPLGLRDLGAVRLRGLAQPERVFQVLHPALRDAFPALRMLETTPHNLPQPLTSFVGRAHELAEGTRQLDHTRLLTLLGIGGLGKSRLSVAIAFELLDRFPDGAWFVELAPVTDARLVPQAVASVLGVKEERGHTVREALVQFVRERGLLLILDNCEHLVQACAELARDLLQASATIKILASSRERLNVRGEKVYALAPLAVPSPRQPLAPEALLQYPAARLFVDRARDAQPDFAVTPENAAAIAEICQRLDGIPLALELAAARVRVMPVATIATRLNDRFRLLRGGDRTALPRQQTLQALIDWSYDLLDEDERTVFRRIAVCAGGVSLEAAEAVCADETLDGADVLDLLTRLVEKSLVTVDHPTGRYHMLETVRQYAQDRLEESREGPATRERHLAYFLDLVVRTQSKLLGAEQKRAAETLDQERENILVAHRWCDRAPDGAERGLRLTRSVQVYWFLRGLLGLGLQLALEALARPGAEARTVVRCRSLSGAGQLALYMGRYAEARRYLDESLSIARELNDASRVSAVLQPLGMAALGEGDLAAARGMLEEALAMAEANGNKREIAAACSALAQLRRTEHALGEAESLNRRALGLSREIGDPESVAVALLNLAMVAIAREEARPARESLLQAMDFAGSAQSKPCGKAALEVSVALAALRSEWTLAARLFGAAESQVAETGIRRDAADDAFLAPFIRRVRAVIGDAAFDAAVRAGKALALDQALAEARAWLERVA